MIGYRKAGFRFYLKKRKKEEDMWWITIALIILLSLFSCTDTAYNADELRNVMYDVEIADIPLGFEHIQLDKGTIDIKPENIPQIKTLVDEESAENSVVVASEFGQKFICSLPEVPKSKVNNDSRTNLTVNLISDVIAASFYVQNCIRVNTGWWTYELCYKKHVQQFHLEGPKIVGNVISLGYFKNNSELNLLKHKSEERPYFEQIYDDGTICDVTEKSRLARVWFMCDDRLSTSEAYISDVDEPSSCEYTIKVKTGSLCKLDAFLVQNEPREPLSIMCRPLLEQTEAEQYLQKIIDEKRQNKEAEKKSELLAAQAESIQRQRYARKRLTIRTVEGINEFEAAEKELKIAYEDIMKSITKLNVDPVKTKVDLHFIYDDLHEMETRYISEEDEDRGNLYWYFKDPYWNRKYFPITHAYSRANNNFYLMMSTFLKTINEDYVERMASLSQFLENIDVGVITETHLSIMIGSLKKAFHEGIFPDVVNDVDDSKNPMLKAMWSDVEKQLELLQLFEYKILKLLGRGIPFSPDDLMSHVARQLLSIRALLTSTGSNYNAGWELSFVAVEKLFLKFAQSHNRALLRFDKKSWGHFLKRDSVEAFRSFANPNMFIARIEDLRPENVHLYYKDTYETESHWEKEAAGEGTKTSDQNMEEQRGMGKEEQAARQRMLQRAKRKNLREKVEHYLRSKKTAKKVKSDETLVPNDLDGLRKQLLVFKNTLEDKIRETGLIRGAEVKVQLVSSTGNVIAGTGIEGMDNERFGAILKAFFLEQDSVSDEENRYDRLARGYTYGADEEAREKIRNTGGSDDDNNGGDDDNVVAGGGGGVRKNARRNGTTISRCSCYRRTANRNSTR